MKLYVASHSLMLSANSNKIWRERSNNSLREAKPKNRSNKEIKFYLSKNELRSKSRKLLKITASHPKRAKKFLKRNN